MRERASKGLPCSLCVDGRREKNVRFLEAVGESLGGPAR